jgi:hypothetical protein
MPNTTELIASLASALIFACLASVFFMAQAKKHYDLRASEGPPGLLRAMARAAAILLLSLIVALLGGLMAAAPLSSVNYLLEIDIFRGVKLAQLLPMAFFALAFLAYFGLAGDKPNPGRLEARDLIRILDTPIRFWMVLAGLAAAAAGAYYILRTGHEVLEVSQVEMLFRNELEELLLARPRSKEFLFAFPAAMLAIYAAGRGFRFFAALFGFCGVVGFTSVINTFLHLRTPLYLGFARTAYAALFGVLIGAAAILLFDALRRLYERLAPHRPEAPGA